MKRARCALMCLPLLASLPVQAFEWGDLWRNPEQRAQQMLDAGHPDAAAKNFVDPQRKAYAQARAGQNAQAAQTLAGQTNINAMFNRGNALARAGKLQEALTVYDNVLKENPQDADAHRNRDRVAQALKDQTDQQDKPPAKQQNKPDNKSSDASGANSGQSKQSDASGQAEPNKSHPAQPGTSQAGQGKQASPSDGSAQTSGTSKGDKPDSTSASQGRGSAASAPSAGNPSSGHTPSGAGQAGAQDKRENGAGQSQPAAGLAGHEAQASPSKTAKTLPGQVLEDPKSEQAMAMEQWLRRIPDDPGGLLRRKFEIEHQMRQQHGENAQ